jgi:hypothetical protein
MGLFTLQCKTCQQHDEYVLGPDDKRLEVPCTVCGTSLTRAQNRAIWIDGPTMNIAGDTVAGGATRSDYFDAGLGEYITSRSHRKSVMDRKGLEEYSPDPTMQRHRDEANYIREQAPAGDPIADAAARAEYKTAADKRRTRLVEESLSKSWD